MNIYNQRIEVMRKLKENGFISRNYAIRSMFITRLSSIIHTLKHEYGWEIDTETTTKPNECVYRLVKAGRNSK